MLRSRSEPFHFQNSLDSFLPCAKGGGSALVRAKSRNPQIPVFSQANRRVQQRPLAAQVFAVRSDGVKAGNGMLRLVNCRDVQLAADVSEQGCDCHNFNESPSFRVERVTFEPASLSTPT